MSLPNENIHIEAGEKIPTLLGLRGTDWIKLIALAFVVYVVYGIVESFQKASSNPALKNLGDAFGNTTAALAWATGHWYLFLIAGILSPMVPAAGKWVANYIGGALKDPKIQETPGALGKFTDGVISAKAKDEASQTTDPTERAKWETKDDNAIKDFESGQGQEQDTARNVGNEGLAERGLPPINEASKTTPFKIINNNQSHFNDTQVPFVTL